MRQSGQQDPNRNSFNLKFFDLQIDSTKLQTIITQNISEAKYSQTINNTFKFLSLIQKYKSTHDVTTQQIIKSSFQNKLIDSRLAPIFPVPIQIINPSKPYPMIKVGNRTSKQVERECKLTKDGIMQSKDNRLLEIKSVIQIEKKGEGKQSDISWIKDHAKYPYRVVMKDANNLLRAVFAQTFEQAKQIQDYCIIHLSKTNEQFEQLIKKGTKKFKDQVTNTVAERISIKNRLNENKKKLGGSNRVSQQQRQEREAADLVANQRKKNEILKVYMQKNSDKLILSQLVKDWEYLSLDEGNQIEKHQQLIVPPSNSNNKSIPPTPRSVVEPPVIQVSNSRLQKAGDFIENFTLIFERIELLKQSNILRKPVLEIKINKGSHNVLYQQTFETILQKQNPHLIYLLFTQNQSLKEIELEQQLNKLQIVIIVRDRLLPTIMTHSLRLRVKERTNQLLYLASYDGSVRLQVRYRTDDDIIINETKQKLINQDGLVLICKQLDDADIDKIKNKYWNIDNKNEYYSSNTTFDVTQILGRLEVVPKFWWFGVTEQQYQILSLIEAASETLSFILIESHLFIIRSLMKIFQNSDKMVEKVFKSFLSIILYYLKPYFSKSELEKIQNLHIMIGVDVNCDLPLKMSLELNAMNKILNLQIPDLMEKYKHKNVHLGLICYEYLFEIYSRNFNIRLLTSLWNYIFKFPEFVQQNLLLLSIALIKINSEALLKVYRYPEIINVLTEQNKKYTDFNSIVSLLQSLKKKYFTKSDSVLETFKTKLLEQNPFDTVINSFYKKQNAKLDNNSKNKIIQKKKTLQKLISKCQFNLPKYDIKTHNLHIYFHKLPNIQPFFLELKIKNVEHQCTKIKPDTYYIVRKVNSPVEIVLTYAGKKWSAVAELIQGIHYAALTLTEEKNSESVFVIQYTGGFLTQSQQVAILRGKPSQHYLGSYMKFQNIVGECLRQIGDCYFLQTIPKSKIPYEITQNLKVLFTSGSNRFNDIDFYLSWILELKISPLEKLEKLKLYAETIWTQLFHSSFFQLYKILFREFLEKMNFPIEDEEFEFLYNGSLEEFDCPRIISLKFINYDKKKVRLDKYIQKLVSEKSSRYLLSDIIINHKNLFSLVLHNLQRQKVTNIDGVLILKYASYGLVKKRIIPLKHQKSSNQLVINNQHQAFVPGTYKIKDVIPELLGTESYPSFSRITNRLYNQDTQLSTLKSKYFQGQSDDLEKKKSSQTLNVIGCLYDKLKCTLPLRYRKQCFITHLPFLSYYSQLMYQIIYPPLPRLFFKAVEVPPIKICTFNGGLQLSDNNRNQNQPVNKRLGLHGNISKWNFNTRIIYFWPSKKQQSFKTLYPVFVNYGEGVFRTEHCIVHGYCRSLKNKYKIFFIIELQGKNILIPREELLVDNIDIFAEIDLNNEKLSRFKRIIKEYEGKTKEEKDNEIAESMKFTNVIKREGDFSDTKGMKYYMKTFNNIM